MRSPHSEGDTGRVEGCGEPSIVAAQFGSAAFDLATEGLNSGQNLLQVRDLDIQAGTCMRSTTAGGPLQTSDALPVGLDDPIVRAEFGVRERGLELPAPHRGVEVLEGLRFRSLNLPPND